MRVYIPLQLAWQNLSPEKRSALCRAQSVPLRGRYGRRGGGGGRRELDAGLSGVTRYCTGLKQAVP